MLHRSCDCRGLGRQEVRISLGTGLLANLRNRVRCHLVSVRVQVLHLAVVGPLVRHVEGGGDRATVGIDTSTFEQILVQLFVQIVNGIVEGQQHNLGHLLDGQLSGNVLSAAVAIRQQANVLAALGSSLIRGRLWVQRFRTARWIAVDVDELLRLGNDVLCGLQRRASTSAMNAKNYIPVLHYSRRVD